MKLLKIFICSLVFINMSSAQFGVSARYTKNSVKQWSDTYQSYSQDDRNLFESSLEFGVNYWFRLKNHRVEFLPEITYATSESANLTPLIDVIGHKMTSYNFNMNVQIYPLDFDGDCDCPTWSKDGNLVKKGFYWLLSAGLSRHSLSDFPDTLTQQQDKYNIVSPRFGIGAGLDIGLGDLLTISPFAMYSINLSNDWITQDVIYPSNGPLDDNSANLNQLQLGLRVIFRPDYKN